MAVLIHHAAAIVQETPPVTTHNEYPKHMTHPAYQHGSIGQEVRSPGGFTHYVGGTPIRFPPVLVNDADQEAYHAAQGYESQGKSDPAAFARAVAAAPATASHTHQEYPKWVGGVLVNDAQGEAEAATARRAQLAIKAPATAAPAAAAALAPSENRGLQAMADADAMRIAELEAKLAVLHGKLAEVKKHDGPTHEVTGDGKEVVPEEPVKTGGPQVEAREPKAGHEPAPLASDVVSETRISHDVSETRQSHDVSETHTPHEAEEAEDDAEDTTAEANLPDTQTKGQKAWQARKRRIAQGVTAEDPE